MPTTEIINIIKQNVNLNGLFEMNSSHLENTKDAFVNTVPPFQSFPGKYSYCWYLQS